MNPAGNSYLSTDSVCLSRRLTDFIYGEGGLFLKGWERFGKVIVFLMPALLLRDRQFISLLNSNLKDLREEFFWVLLGLGDHL